MERILKIIEESIGKHKKEIDNDTTIKSQEKGYLYALEDIRDEIKTMMVDEAVKDTKHNKTEIQYGKNKDNGYECTECGNISMVWYKCCDLCGNDNWKPVK